MVGIGICGSGHPKYKFWKSASEKRTVYFVDVVDARYFVDDLPKEQQERFYIYASKAKDLSKRVEDNIAAIKESINMGDKSIVLVISNMDQLCDMIFETKKGKDLTFSLLDEYNSAKSDIINIMDEIKSSNINFILSYVRKPRGISQVTVKYVDELMDVDGDTPFESYETVLASILEKRRDLNDAD